MACYRITHTVSGRVLGVYEAASEAEALDALAQDAGYRDHAEACEVAPVAEGELLVEEVEMRWRVGDRVEAGEIAEDYDTGTVRELDTGSGTVGCAVMVAWDSGVTTPADCDLLRPEGERPVGRA